MTILARTTDPAGRPVMLDERGWRHVRTEHADMAIIATLRFATVSWPHH